MPSTATTILIDGTPTNGADPWLDSLVWGGAWTDSDGGKVTITYSTPSVGYLEGEQSLNWTPQALAALGQALALWESVANIDFVEFESPFADALFWVGTQSQAGGPGILGWSEVPGYTDHEHLNVVFNGQDPSWSAGGLARGGYGFVTLVHEIGHLLGLAHPHDGGAAWDATTFPGVDAPFDDYGDDDLNQGLYTVMSYNSGWPAAYSPKSPNWGFEAGPMALDIAAIQAIYGANTTYASGNDVYKLPTANGAGTYWSTIWDTGGVDTISSAGWSGNATIDLRAARAGSDGGGNVSHGYTSWGEMILGGFTIARGVVIENAIGGSGDDTIIGNAAANRLEGGAGRDTLDGQSGADTMIGGSGNDAYYVENSGDVIVELDAWAETDIVYSSVSYTLSAYIEHLTLMGTASINGTGNASDNTIVGNSGDNILDGGGGVDYLYGGKGNDTYILRGNQAHGVELADEGIDTIRTSWGGELEANFENMELLDGAWSATGNEYDNRLVGNSGSNYLDGGLGADTMIGGRGGDTYYVDNPLDVVIEEDDDLGGGWDEIFVEFTYSLVGLTKVEYLNLSHAGTANIDATGNDLKNALYGSDGNNVLDGRAGADFMMGLKGNDTYIVDDVGDYVSESAGQGNDTVRSSASAFTLHDNVENLILTGTASIGGTGNALANSLTGNAGDNVLDGGAGNDTMAGGLGADTYVVDAAGDVVTERAGEGTDTVNAWLGWTLGANLEQLRLMGTAGINGTGNGLNNALFGNNGKNVLDGAAGADTMSGGLGDDTYVVDQSDDIVIEAANGGTDLVQSSAASFQLGANVENLVLSGSGSINGAGNELRNVLTGNAGKNVLDGGGGADWMTGGSGDDTYVVDHAGDVVKELAGDGVDTVLTPINWTLGANIERLTLTGAAHVNGIGNELANAMAGNAGNNLLDGGAAADTMAGGLGDDTYVVDVAGDVVTEGVGEGTDTVNAWLGWTLGANFEQLRLMGAADLSGTGNSLNNALFGNAGKNVLNGGAGADTMTGGLGDDTYVVDNAGDVVVEAAGGGTDLVQSSAATYQLGANVEILVLTGSDNINGTGNELANVLTGNAGKNVLDGGAGADAMSGGASDDTYVVDNAGDVVTELAGGGSDTVLSSISWKLVANVEKLTLTGTANLVGTGNELANTLIGNAGNNVLDGGSGIDTMAGGLGDDTYVVDVAGEIITEGADQGTDTVNAWLGWTLGANLEQLRLMGTTDLNGTGNGLNNALFGNTGKNVLNGGAGADTMSGGLGDDTYVVDQSDDVVVEAFGAGVDLIQSAATYQLLGTFVENLVLVGKASINGTGNLLKNVLTGNAGNNVLDGGADADTMAGGAGNDTYIVDNIGDVVIEAAASGIDTVISSVAWTLGANLEKLTLVGLASIAGTGNELANTLAGNAGGNILDGGAGIDRMAGGLGNDIYIVDNSGDVVVEADAEGSDLVRASVNYTLSAHVEKLTLEGTADLRGTGNELVNTITGNAGNNILDGKAGADTMSGGLGDDTYIVDDAGDILSEAAAAGIDTVQSSVTWRLKANFEKLILTGLSNLDGTGNELANLLTGNAANNLLDGGLGADSMAGGLGNDTYIVDNAGDVIVEAAGGGNDTVRASLTYELHDNVENLTLMGKANINGTGNAANNLIIGNAVHNVLDGGAGADRMEGGAGNDTYIVDNAGDVVVEAVNSGADEVQASISYTLTGNVEKLKLSGIGNLDGTGNDLANTLTGNDGNNRLDGGLGADTMAGGLGDDTYIVDNAGDLVSEAVAGGIDTVRASITLGLRDNLETLVLTGTAAINGTGNALNNVIVGNAGNNILDGGAGADRMEGGAGNDTYIVDNAGDVVVEVAAVGGDEVQASISYALTANVERLKLSGTGNLDGTGNGLANTLTGNTGNNRLDGGAGADTMTGGVGDDTYVIDNTGDVVVEAAGGGIDTVQSSISYTLGANFERLVLTGNAALNGTGSAGDDVLMGNGANNVLDGGAGADAMAGGDGDDTYIVDNAGDVVTELMNGGTDLVSSSVSHVLTANVETLTLTGKANIDATGNELANTLTGNAGHNILDGGLGADILVSGGGGDTFRFSTALGPDNIDRILLFSHNADTMQLDHTVFAGLGTGVLATGAFNIGAVATQADDRILFDTASKSLYYDADGLGGADAVRFATIDTFTGTLDHTDFLIV